VTAPAPPVALRAGDRTTVVVRDGPLAAPVLSRTVSIVAARAGLPLDRLNDAVLVADAVVAHAPRGRLAVAIDAGVRQIVLRVGPLSAGDARRLLAEAALPDTGNVIERLADDVGIRPASAGGEYLVVRIAYAEQGDHAGRAPAAGGTASAGDPSRHDEAGETR
jgi:serine/threonine-protein kinase RsbW